MGKDNVRTLLNMLLKNGADLMIILVKRITTKPVPSFKKSLSARVEKRVCSRQITLSVKK